MKFPEERGSGRTNLIVRQVARQHVAVQREIDDARRPEAESHRGGASRDDGNVAAAAAAALHAGVEPVLHELAAAVALPVLGVLWWFGLIDGSLVVRLLVVRFIQSVQDGEEISRS